MADELNNQQPDSTPKGSAAKNDDDEEGGWLGGCIMLILVGLAIWGLVHFNPSEEEHYEAIGETLAEHYLDGETLSLRGAYDLARLDHTSIGICSWTYVKKKGKFYLATVGACGQVFCFID